MGLLQLLNQNNTTIDLFQMKQRNINLVFFLCYYLSKRILWIKEIFISLLQSNEKNLNQKRKQQFLENYENVLGWVKRD